LIGVGIIIKQRINSIGRRVGVRSTSTIQDSIEVISTLTIGCPGMTADDVICRQLESRALQTSYLIRRQQAVVALIGIALSQIAILTGYNSTRIAVSARIGSDSVSIILIASVDNRLIRLLIHWEAHVGLQAIHNRCWTTGSTS
jgi:hypothetical protein